jgi:hypothetical protein
MSCVNIDITLKIRDISLRDTSSFSFCIPLYTKVIYIPLYIECIETYMTMKLSNILEISPMSDVDILPILRHVLKYYPPSDTSSLLLLPYKRNKESYVTIMSTILYLELNCEVIVIGTNDRKQEGGIWRPREYTDCRDEDSLMIPGYFLSKLGYKVVYLLPEPTDRYKQIAHSLLNQKNIIISTNISNDLNSETTISKMSKGIDEDLNNLHLQLAVYLTDRDAKKSNKRYGIVTMYNCSNVGMVWLHEAKISLFDLHFLVSYIKLWIKGKDHEFPRWNPLSQVLNGIVISFEENHGNGNYDKKYRLFIGENNDVNMSLGVKMAIQEVVNSPMGRHLVSQDIQIHIDILSSVDKWFPYSNQDINGYGRYIAGNIYLPRDVDEEEIIKMPGSLLFTTIHV